jgi:hypothetical protein
MGQECDRCGQNVKGLVKVSGTDDLYTYPKNWCFACVYEQGLVDFNKRKTEGVRFPS